MPPPGSICRKQKGVAGGVDRTRPGIDKTSLSPISCETLSISIPGMGLSSPGLSVPRPTHFIPLLPRKSRGYSFGIVLPVLSHGSNFFYLN